VTKRGNMYLNDIMIVWKK